MSKTISNDYPGTGAITNNNTINVVVQPPSGTSLCPLVGNSGNDAFCVKINGDASDRLSILYDGFVDFGDGTNAPDTRIQRVAANELAVTGGTLDFQTANLSSTSDSTSAIAITNTLTGANPKLAIKMDGSMQWSAGNNPEDTNLYRSSAGNLTLSTTALGSPDGKLRLATTYTNAIITNSGDLFISPVGSNINVDSHNINNVASILLNAAGLTQLIGTSQGTLTVQDNAGNPGSIRVSNIYTVTGDLSINPTGNINFNNKSLNNANTIQVGTVTTSSGDLIINPVGSNINISSKNLTNVQQLQFTQSAAGTTKTSTSVTGDAQQRISINTDSILLGDGTNAPSAYITGSTLSTVSIGTAAGNSNGILAAKTINVFTLNPSSFGSTLNVASGSNFATVDGTIAAVKTTGNAITVKSPADLNQRLQVSNSGEMQWGPGSATQDSFLYRDSATSLTLSASTGGALGGTIKSGTMVANTYTNSSGDLNVVSTTGSNVTLRALSNIINFKNVGNYVPFYFDLANYQMAIAVDGFAADTFLKRTAGGTLTLGTFSGANNGAYVGQTFSANGSVNTTLAMSANITGNAQSNFTLDMDGQHAWSSGSANRDIWLYRDGANSLTLSNTSRGTATGTFKCGTISATSVKSKFGASTYYNSPIVLYNQRVNVSVAAGIDGVASITLPSGLMASTGDQLVLTIEGNGNGATSGRTVLVNINGTSYEAFNLVSGTGSMWRAVYQMTRASDTTCDVVGVYWHSTTSGTFGNAAKSCTSLSSGGTINVQTNVTNAGDITVRDIKIEFIPIQS